jgi:hypothetical protein
MQVFEFGGGYVEWAEPGSNRRHQDSPPWDRRADFARHTHQRRSNLLEGDGGKLSGPAGIAIGDGQALPVLTRP